MMLGGGERRGKNHSTNKQAKTIAYIYALK